MPPLPEPQPRISDKFERPRGTLVDNLAKFEVRTETSVRTATSKSIVMQRSNNALFAKRNGLLFNNNKTEVTQEVSAANNDISEMLIRGFCRKPPMESENPHCFRAEALYFYNVTSNICEPFYKGHCARSRNKFNSIQDCQEKCVINNNNQRSSLVVSRPFHIKSTDSNNSAKNVVKFKRPGFESGIPPQTSTTTTTKRPNQLFKRPRTLFNRRRTARLF